MNRFLIVFLLFTSSVAFGQDDSTMVKYWKAVIDTSEFKIINRVEHIDPWLFIRFPDWESMANPEKRFNATDNGRGPRKRLFFAAQFENNWIVSYEHGGRGYHTHCFLVNVNQNHEILILDSNKKFKTMADLKKAAADTLLIEKWNEYDY